MGEEEEGRFITMPLPPQSNEKIQKNQKPLDDLSSPSALLSTPNLFPSSHKQIEVGVMEKGEEEGMMIQIVSDLFLFSPLYNSVC